MPIESYGAIACQVGWRGYSCMSCNKWYALHDPEFVYYREFTERNWLVKEGMARIGDPMCLIDPTAERMSYKRTVSGGYEGLGWFAHCRDREACARRRQNVHAGVHPEQIGVCCT